MSEKYCPECGATVGQTAKFCPECGVPLTKSAKGAKANTSLRDIAIIVGALVVVGVAYFFVKGGRPSVAQMGAAPQQAAPNQSKSAPGLFSDSTDPHGNGTDMSMAKLDSLPKDFNLRVQMGNQYMDQGNYAMAAEVYRRALDLNPNDQDVRVDYGACLHGMGLPQRAVEEFGKVLKVNPDHQIANFNMGVVYFDLKKTDSAKFYLNNYLKLAPNGPAAERSKEFLKEIGG